MFPLTHSLDVEILGPPAVDRFGNERPGSSSWVSQPVASWWVDRTEEKSGDSVLRTIDYLHAHFPVGKAPDAGARVRTPDGRVWHVQGNAEDFNHGWHGWKPGLVVVHCKGVVG